MSKYTQHEDKLDWTGLTFPVSLQDIPKFERRNHISVNVYGFDVKTSVHLLQKSQLIDSKQHIDLLLLTKGAQSHYCWIKHFNRFARQPSDHKHTKKHFCRHCLHGFPTKQKLEEHLSHGCREITEVKPRMPTREDAVVQFKNFDKQHKAPFVVYANFAFRVPHETS